MRRIQTADVEQLRAEVCHLWVGDRRADDAFDYAIEFLAANELPRGADQNVVSAYRSRMRFAVSFRARNEQRMSADAIEWTEISDAICYALVEWMIDAPRRAEVCV
jgi:hypothetical protein